MWGGLLRGGVTFLINHFERDYEDYRGRVGMAQSGRIDLIVNRVAAPHALDPFLQTLKRDGAMVLVGVPAEPHPSPSVGAMIFRRRRLAGSLIGGIAETQEMLDFCAKHDIVFRHRDHPDPGDRRGLRPDGERRCEVPVRDRLRVVAGVIGAA